MKKLLALFFSFALVFAVSANVSFASDDKDCKDFKTWKEAQDYFESKGGSKTNNVDRLDNDHDGLACEDLQGFDPNHKNPNDDKGSNDNTGNNNSGNNNSGNSGNSGNNGSNNKDGGKLPKTATSYPTWMLAGASLLLLGVGVLARRKV